MKKIVKYIVLAVATMFAVGCTPDYPTLDESQLPLASELDVEILVDQTTNMVTFTLKNQGMTPMWIFPETDKPDDSATKKAFSVAINGYTARFRDAGTHSVEVKAYNVNGVSQGSITKEFTLENTYRDPFDQSKYMNAIAGEWMWNSTVDNHFGCGDSTGNPTGWWPCPANGKEGMGLYDDRMTFTADGKYTFNPGEGGTVYVNWGANELYPDQWDGTENDYQVPMDEHTSDFHFENNWNDAGIEEIYLVLTEGTNLSYIPHVEAVTTNTRYLVVDSKPADMRKKLNLVWFTPTGNGGGPIAWKYEFVPAVKVVTPEELLAGTDAAGKAWVMDSAAQGHLGCGESVENAAGWWSAGPNEKADFGLYDNELTFCPDGTYKFNPGPDGEIYVNVGINSASGIPGAQDAAADYDMVWSEQEGTYTFENNIITLPEGFTIGYLPFASNYFTPSWTVTELTEKTLKLVAFSETENGGGPIAWQFIFRARDYKEPDATIGGVAVENGKVELDIAQGDVLAVTGIDLSTMWIDPDFFELQDATSLKFLAVDGEYRIQKLDSWLKVVPLEGGDKATYDNDKALWIIGDGGGKPEGEAHLIGWNTGEAPLPMARISENEYRITLWMKAEGGSIKVFGQSDWGVEWKSAQYGTVNGNDLFYISNGSDGKDDGNIYTEVANEKNAGYYTFHFTDNDGILDMSVEPYVPVVPAQTQWDPAAACNLWNTANFTTEFYYATTDAWTTVDPAMGFEEDGNTYTIDLHTATVARWQAQVKFHTEMSSSADKYYDFQVKMMSTKDHPAVMIKLTQDGDDNNFYCADESHGLVAYEEMTFRLENFAGKDMEKIMLVLDFGLCAEGTEVEVYDIIFQEHTVVTE